MIRKFLGLLIALFGAVLVGWIAYNLFIERLPAAQGRNPIPAALVAAGCLFVGWKWMGDQDAD
jgi:hypothetical protein